MSEWSVYSLTSIVTLDGAQNASSSSIVASSNALSMLVISWQSVNQSVAACALEEWSRLWRFFGVGKSSWRSGLITMESFSEADHVALYRQCKVSVTSDGLRRESIVGCSWVLTNHCYLLTFIATVSNRASLFAASLLTRAKDPRIDLRMAFVETKALPAFPSNCKE